MSDALDKWTKVHRLGGEAQYASRAAAYRAGLLGSARDMYEIRLPTPPSRPLPIAETKYILKHGKAAWRAKRDAGEGFGD